MGETRPGEKGGRYGKTLVGVGGGGGKCGLDSSASYRFPRNQDEFTTSIVRR